MLQTNRAGKIVLCIMRNFSRF